MPAMDLDISKPADTPGATPPTVVISPIRPVNSNVDSMDATAQPPVPPEIERIRKKAAKRRKKKMAPAAPAVNVIRGFHTPVTSGGEESEGSVIGSPLMTPRMASLAEGTGSPRLTPSASSSGISALKIQLDALNMDKQSSRPGLTREISNTSGFESTATSSAASDSDKTEMDTYEVNFEQDFVSPDACAKLGGSQTPLATVEGGLRTQSALRKMAADDFEPLRCLGKGAFGTVHLVKHNTTGRLYAQKQFRKASLTVHKRLVEQTRAERSILESVNRHPFVVKLFYAFQDHEKLYLILEYAQGGELFTHLAMERMFSEETAAFYMAEMVLALEHLHTNVRVVYRDLKPENCLLDSEGHLLLTDFGLSKVALEEDECNSILGTIEYMAPEVVQGTNYGMAVDWWSLGAIGFDLLTGAPPFQGNNHAKIQQNILKQKLQLPYFLGPDAKDLLTRLLRKEPSKRLGGNMPKDMQLIKKHRFFRRIDWRKLGRREVEPPIRPLITDPELAENFSKEFTDLPMSPVVERTMMFHAGVGANGCPVGSNDVDMTDPFGGFSFVASQSLLETEDFMI